MESHRNHHWLEANIKPTMIPLVTYRSSPTSRDVDVEYYYYPGATDYRIILLDGYYPE